MDSNKDYRLDKRTRDSLSIQMEGEMGRIEDENEEVICRNDSLLQRSNVEVCSPAEIGNRVGPIQSNLDLFD